MNISVADTHMIVLPGGGYAEHAPYEAEPVAGWLTYRFASALAASHVPHTVHMFAHGPHGLGLARDAGEAAIWTTLANAWIHEQA